MEAKDETPTLYDVVYYTEELNESAKYPKRIKADQFEAICKKTRNNCYEVISDDKPVRLYFDIDYGRPVDNDIDEAEYMETTEAHLIRIAKELISENLGEYHPEFAVTTSSSPSYRDYKSGKMHWKTSVHLIVPNIVAMKCAQGELIKMMNDLARRTTDFQDYMDNAVNLFDESIQHLFLCNNESTCRVSRVFPPLL